MGNIESTQRQYTAEQLQQLEKADIQILQILDSELFDDNFICQKVASGMIFQSENYCHNSFQQLL